VFEAGHDPDDIANVGGAHVPSARPAEFTLHEACGHRIRARDSAVARHDTTRADGSILVPDIRDE
jgi:hypothetical protein